MSSFTSKYKRLHVGQKILASFEICKQLDKLEPITDLTQAKTYLKKWLTN